MSRLQLPKQQLDRLRPIQPLSGGIFTELRPHSSITLPLIPATGHSTIGLLCGSCGFLWIHKAPD